MGVVTARLADHEYQVDEAEMSGTAYPVLVIDDHELFSSSLTLALRGEGFDARTLTVASVEDFLSLPATTPTGLVVLDLDLGWDANGRHVDGVDLIHGFRARGWMVLIVSGNDDWSGVAAAIAAGAIGSVPKSGSFGLLVRAVVTAAEGAPVMTNAEHRTWLERHRKYLAQVRHLSLRLARLSPREGEVLELLAEGMRAAAIAQHFVVSMPTVRTQIRSILTKLGVGSQLEAVALLRQQQEIDRRCGVRRS